MRERSPLVDCGAREPNVRIHVQQFIVESHHFFGEKIGVMVLDRDKGDGALAREALIAVETDLCGEIRSVNVAALGNIDQARGVVMAARFRERIRAKQGKPARMISP